MTVLFRLYSLRFFNVVFALATQTKEVIKFSALRLILTSINTPASQALFILVPFKIPKFYKIFHHIESFNMHKVLNIAK